jgi:hypothetical protein
MMETLGDLKNNKLKHLAPPAGEAESAERLKKFLSGLNKNHHCEFSTIPFPELWLRYATGNQ